MQANLYITPPKAQGFSKHKDDHEVLAIQICGSKVWRLSATDGAHEVVLAAGGLLYVPAGLEHEAASAREPSIHIALGLKAVYAFQLLEELADSARHHPAFRYPLRPQDTFGPI